MNPFTVLHHYCCQNGNLNVSVPHNSYITHPTGAGPGDCLVHRDGPLDQVNYQLECDIFSCNTTCHSCCQIGNGHCDYFTMTTHTHTKRVLLTTSITHGQWNCRWCMATTTAATAAAPPPPDWKQTKNI